MADWANRASESWPSHSYGSRLEVTIVEDAHQERFWDVAVEVRVGCLVVAQVLLVGRVQGFRAAGSSAVKKDRRWQ